MELIILLGFCGSFGFSFETGGFLTITEGLGVPFRIEVEEYGPSVNGLLRVSLTLDVFDRFNSEPFPFLEQSFRESVSFDLLKGLVLPT